MFDLPKKILIEWLDATSSKHPWIDEDVRATVGENKYYSCAFLVDEDDDYIHIAQSLSDGQMGHYTAIPRSCVIKITELKEIKNK